jgi:hypothetical protein
MRGKTCTISGASSLVSALPALALTRMKAALIVGRPIIVHGIDWFAILYTRQGHQDLHSNVKDKLDWKNCGLFFSFFLARERVATSQLAAARIENDIEQRHCVHALGQTADYGVETPVDL